MPSKRLRAYIEADAAGKEAEKLKKAERAYVEKLLKRCERMGVSVRGVSFYQSEKITINEDEVFDYIRSMCLEPVLDSNGNETLDPETLLPITKLNLEKFDKFCRRVIDLEALPDVSQQLNMDILPLPSFCYKITKSDCIKIDHKRV